MQGKPKNFTFQRQFMHLRFREMIESHFCTGHRTNTTFFLLSNKAFGLTSLICLSYRDSKYPNWKF